MIKISQFENIPSSVDPKVHEWILAEYAACHNRYMVAGPSFMTRALNDEEFVPRILKFMESIKMSYLGAHSFWGAEWDMNQLDKELHAKMLENQKKVIDIAGMIEAGVLVIHPGDKQFATGNPSLLQLREQLFRTLDILLPYAQKRKIRIALENIIAPSDSAEEIFTVLEHYKSPSLVLCYDSGHANVMETAPGKDPGNVCEYIRHTLWHDKLKLYSGNTLELLSPYVVTAHLHDNNGYEDQHKMPGDGTINWPSLIKGLKNCPKLEFIQNETDCLRYRIPIHEKIRRFNRQFAEL